MVNKFIFIISLIIVSFIPIPLSATNYPSTITSDLTLVGQQDSEATTTSTTVVDLCTVSNLAIATTDIILITFNARKTTGAAADANYGLKLNATTVIDPVTMFDATDEAASGMGRFWVGTRDDSDYLSNVGGLYWSGVDVLNTRSTAAQPSATITNVIIVALVDNALVTIACDSVKVYTLSGT